MSPNWAAAPVPSALPCDEPAKSELTPPGVTLSTVCPVPRWRLPEASIATPCGPPMSARKVDTTPAGVILRTAAFWKSVTNTSPDASTAVLAWPPKLPPKSKRAAAPVASTSPKCEASPAIVVTTPAGVTWRTTKPFSSAT
jgi:hypothetical protein